MKNLKVGKKFLAAFGSIVALFLVAVIVASMTIISSKSSYEDFFTKGYQASSHVYEMRVNLQHGLRELCLAILTDDPQQTQKYLQTVDERSQAVQTGLQWVYGNYDGDVSKLKEFETKLTDARPVLDQIREALKRGDEQGDSIAQQLMTDQYQPLVDDYVNTLVAASDQMNAASQEQYDASVASQNLMFAMAVLIAVVALILTVLIAVKLTGYILRPLQMIGGCMEEVMNGNLSAKVDYASGDEFGEMAVTMSNVTSGVKNIIADIEQVVSHMADGDFTVTSQSRESYVGDYRRIHTALAKLKATFNETLTTLGQSADQVSSGADQVSAGAQALSQGATEQASSVEELAASINEISDHITKNAEGAGETRKKAAVIGEEAGESNKRMQDMLTAMSDISSCSSEIGKIIKTIEDIAFQTNILALNAAIEAARAGAAGKGFAVVADEVRNLASKSAEASKNTAVLIENSLKAVDNGRVIADETAKSLELVVEGIDAANKMMESITTAAQEQAEFVVQIRQGIDQISSVVQTNSATAEESAAASEELSGQAQMLKELAGKFRLDSGYTVEQSLGNQAYAGQSFGGQGSVGQQPVSDAHRYEGYAGMQDDKY